MPDIKLTSYGAAEEVTGSCHLLQVDGFNILIDCGLWQGPPENYARNWEDFSFDSKKINAVILTHAHLDHCGRLPKLFKHGYKGKVYATPPTTELADLVLVDNYEIMTEKIARHKLKLGQLYSKGDLAHLRSNWQATNYYQSVRLNKDIEFQFHNAGHILGSATVELKISNGDDKKTIVFSGDIGSVDMPLVKNIDYLPKADYVIVESTYGDRLHENLANRNQALLEAVQRVTTNNSTLLITIFAIERTQDILKVLNDYYEKHVDFRVPVYLDSPMAISATNIYKKYPTYLNPAAQESMKTDNDIFNFPHLKITRNIRDSKKINAMHPPKIIMAGSGMAEGGRMIHHLAHYVADKKNNILFTGYQVKGTLGRKIVEGNFDFNYYGKTIPIRAAVDQIDGFSAHGDLNALLAWLGSFGASPKEILLAHGDVHVLPKFAATIQEKLQLKTRVIENNQTINLK